MASHQNVFQQTGITNFDISTINEEELQNFLPRGGNSRDVVASAAGDNIEDNNNNNIFSKELFLEAIQNYKCLWDTNNSLYKDRTAKINAWNQLSLLFNTDVLTLQKTLKNLKDNLKRCLDRRKALTRSGAGYATLPTCKYFYEMQFLHERTSNHQTESNISTIQETPSPSPITESSSYSSMDNSLSSPPPLPCPPAQDARKKRKASTGGLIAIDDPFLKHMQKIDDKIISSLENTQAATKIDEVTSFCNSLIPILQEFPKKKMRLARIKINELLYHIEFDTEDLS